MFFFEKPYFPYILDGFSVISLRFSLVFHRGKPYFLYILDGFLVISLRFSLVFPRETLFSLHFRQISCHFLRFLGFEARLVRLERSGGVAGGGGGGGGGQPPHSQTPLGVV